MSTISGAAPRLMSDSSSSVILLALDTSIWSGRLTTASGPSTAPGRGPQAWREPARAGAAREAGVPDDMCMGEVPWGSTGPRLTWRPSLLSTTRRDQAAQACSGCADWGVSDGSGDTVQEGPGRCLGNPVQKRGIKHRAQSAERWPV